MSDDSYQDENPYASPNAPCNPGIDILGRFEPCRTVVDSLDVVLYLSRAAALIGILLAFFAVVAFICNWLSRFHGALWWVGVAASVVVIRRFGKFKDHEVKTVSVDATGLHFNRERISPDDWPWESITAIRPASRWEVAWYGWFRTLLKPRDPTACNSALGYYRIQGQTDYCFFPPKNSHAFVDAIAHYRPDLLTKQE